jgi:hypothetical protein
LLQLQLLLEVVGWNVVLHIMGLLIRWDETSSVLLEHYWQNRGLHLHVLLLHVVWLDMLRWGIKGCASVAIEPKLRSRCLLMLTPIPVLLSLCFAGRMCL